MGSMIGQVAAQTVRDMLICKISMYGQERACIRVHSASIMASTANTSQVLFVNRDGHANDAFDFDNDFLLVVLESFCGQISVSIFGRAPT